MYLLFSASSEISATSELLPCFRGHGPVLEAIVDLREPK
jgi:hypothetical protein